MHYPKNTQPTHVRWEQLPPGGPTNGSLSGKQHLTNGTSSSGDSGATGTIFEPVSEVVARNFIVVDTVFEAPPMSGLGLPGADGNMLAIGPNGLPSVSDEILAELPADCRAALLDAKAKEEEWKNRWTTESADGLRANLKIGFLGYPV
jgi:chromatin structure-remodeling complex protein RSC7